MDRIITIISENKDLLFSGAGIAIIIFVATAIKDHFRNKTTKTETERINNTRALSLESCFLLIYAAYDEDHIVKSYWRSKDVIVSTRKRSFMRTQSQKESAIWQDAVDILLENGLIRLERKTIDFGMYGLTGEGYRKGEELKQSMNVDTTKEPLDELKKEWL